MKLRLFGTVYFALAFLLQYPSLSCVFSGLGVLLLAPVPALEQQRLRLGLTGKKLAYAAVLLLLAAAFTTGDKLAAMGL